MTTRAAASHDGRVMAPSELLSGPRRAGGMRPGAAPVRGVRAALCALPAAGAAEALQQGRAGGPLWWLCLFAGLGLFAVAPPRARVHAPPPVARLLPGLCAPVTAEYGFLLAVGSLAPHAAPASRRGVTAPAYAARAVLPLLAAPPPRRAGMLARLLGALRRLLYALQRAVSRCLTPAPGSAAAPLPPAPRHSRARYGAVPSPAALLLAHQVVRRGPPAHAAPRAT
ncbi:hypothetical protein [Streptomyces sp. ODS28]|uniref:hypothetical protein n=1 Tax=Streptomyces sp. ODS28 TaxID=3136688 RepID=UPI0031EE447A